MHRLILPIALAAALLAGCTTTETVTGTVRTPPVRYGSPGQPGAPSGGQALPKPPGPF